MVLGFSWGEVALILGASAALFGPKDIVIIGRAAGRLTGKAVGYIQSARGHIAPIMQRSEINTVHKELRETMAQLEAIRHEMRTGISIMNPGPLTSHVMENVVPTRPNPAQSSGKGTENSRDLNQRAPVRSAQMQSLQPSSKDGYLPEAMSAGASAAPALAARVGLACAIPMPRESKLPNVRHSGLTPGQELVVLPISAVEAGLLPSNQEPMSGGADIVFASIVERKVAFQSKKVSRRGRNLAVFEDSLLDYPIGVASAVNTRASPCSLQRGACRLG